MLCVILLLYILSAELLKRYFTGNSPISIWKAVAGFFHAAEAPRRRGFLVWGGVAAERERREGREKVQRGPLARTPLQMSLGLENRAI